MPRTTAPHASVESSSPPVEETSDREIVEEDYDPWVDAPLTPEEAAAVARAGTDKLIPW